MTVKDYFVDAVIPSWEIIHGMEKVGVFIHVIEQEHDSNDILVRQEPEQRIPIHEEMTPEDREMLEAILRRTEQRWKQAKYGP